MNNQLDNFISRLESEQFATNTGRVIHAKLQNICIGDTPRGDRDLIKKIMQCGDDIQSFFLENSQTEVPIAGFVNGRFISRRIDRLVVDNNSKIVKVLDYKTDTDTKKFHEKYKAQLQEYTELLKQIYPNYKIVGCILWLHNWHLERI